jgi:NhaP-type Na+/H+ or K+/H+ antiporter
MLTLAYTFHPFATHNLLKTHNFLFRLFANVFFSGIIGMSWAFLASYSLKESNKGLSLGSISARIRENNNNSSDESSTLAIDNFDILMMVLPPVVSYLMAETFSISGFLALIWCSFLQSMYAQSNLEAECSALLLNVFKALSYTFRSICEILIGLSLPLFWTTLTQDLGLWIVALTLMIIFLTSYAASYFVVKRLRASKHIKSDFEALALICQNNTRGLLGLTLALQNFNDRISAIALLYIVISSLCAEPIMNYILNKAIGEYSSSEPNDVK